MYKNIENMLITILKTSWEIWWDFCDNYSMSKKNSQTNILALSQIKTPKFWIFFLKKKEWKKNMKFSNVSVQLEIQYTKLPSRAS